MELLLCQMLNVTLKHINIYAISMILKILKKLQLYSYI